MEHIQTKFESVPHAGQLELWLQRVAAPFGLNVTYSEPLCDAVVDPEFQLWNSNWVHVKHRTLLKASEYVDQGVFLALTPVVQSGEVQLFHYGS